MSRRMVLLTVSLGRAFLVSLGRRSRFLCSCLRRFLGSCLPFPGFVPPVSLARLPSVQTSRTLERHRGLRRI